MEFQTSLVIPIPFSYSSNGLKTTPLTFLFGSGSKVRSASLVRVLCDGKIYWVLWSQCECVLLYIGMISEKKHLRISRAPHTPGTPNVWAQWCLLALAVY